jgi:hypothetical protein
LVRIPPSTRKMHGSRRGSKDQSAAAVEESGITGEVLDDRRSAEWA